MRVDPWLAGSLEDGAFFDAGETTLHGLTVSQGEVRASLSERESKTWLRSRRRL